MTDWQPISSAPRDGTHVLLAIPVDRDPTDSLPPWFQIVGWWDDDINADGEDAGWTDGTPANWNMQEYAIWEPTHWQPLPSPPNQGEG